MRFPKKSNIQFTCLIFQVIAQVALFDENRNFWRENSNIYRIRKAKKAQKIAVLSDSDDDEDFNFKVKMKKGRKIAIQSDSDDDDFSASKPTTAKGKIQFIDIHS